MISAATKSKNPHSNPHNPEAETRKIELLNKSEKKTSDPNEAKELSQILEKELAEMKHRGDAATIIALLLLLGLVAAIIYATTRR